MLSVPDQETGLTRFYQPVMDERYLEVITNGELPKLSRNQIEQLLHNINDTELWLSMLPPEKFEFRGIHIAHLSEVTESESLSRLKHRLISRDAILDVHRVTELADLIRFNFLRNDVSKLTSEEFKGSIYERAYRRPGGHAAVDKAGGNTAQPRRAQHHDRAAVEPG